MNSMDRYYEIVLEQMRQIRSTQWAQIDQAAAWLGDRVARLAPDLAPTTEVEAGGGQFLVVLRS